jgi:hypothetical protein
LLKIKICDAQQFSSDLCLGYVHIPIKTLTEHETKEDWFTIILDTDKEIKDEKSEDEKNEQLVGQLRLKIKYSV